MTFIPVAKLLIDDYNKNPYSFSEINSAVNGNKIKTKIEYYDEFATIRSISIWKNNRKDSIWKVFSRDGRVIKQQTYRNDTLLKE